MKKSKEEIELAKLLKEQIKPAPENGWFVRKVMNRLPEKSQSFFSKSEILSFIICGIILIAGWCYQIIHVTTAQFITTADLFGVSAMFIFSLALMSYIAYPLLKKG